MSWIKVNYETLANAHATFAATAHDIDEQLDGLRARLSKIRWSGAEQEAFQQYRDEWEAAARELTEVLAEMSAALGTALDSYAATERSNVNGWQL
jgi:WXG100 family type VII secretion target